MLPYRGRDPDHGLPDGLRNQHAVLIEGAVLKLDDAAVRLRLRFTHPFYLRLDAHSVAVEERMREDGFRHAEIAGRRAERGVVTEMPIIRPA